jgi:alpha-galactosidase/6-phospho-beta-glucosidase family protein
MKKSVKIVLIGAGSKEFSRGLIHDLVLDAELSHSIEVEAVLVDIHPQRLQTIANLCAAQR